MSVDPIILCKRLLCAAATLSMVVAPPMAAMASPPRSGSELMVADFNSGSKPNNIGGDFGAWTRDPNDPMQGCIETFDRADRFGNSGYALRLVYSVQSSKPAFGGLWMQLRNLDASRFSALAFRVRGDAKMGFTTVFKVELKDSVGQASHFMVSGVTDQWQDVVIPLKDFEGMANVRSLKEFVITFEDSSATTKRGVIYVDDIRFDGSPS